MNDLLGTFPHDFEWRPGERIEVDCEAAQNQAREFRDVLGRYASGVTVVTAMSSGQPVGMTCQSFTSVSLDPPLVAFLPTRQSRSFAAIRRAGTFCVNFLSDGQDQLSEQFAGRGADRFAGVEWSRSAATGSPLLADVVGHVDCTVHAVQETGDHYLVVGKVVDLAVGEAQAPLLYYRGGYRTTC